MRWTAAVREINDGRPAGSVRSPCTVGGIALTTCSRSSAKDLKSRISPFRCELACQSGVKLEYWIEEPCDVSANQYKRLLLVLIVRYIYEVERKNFRRVVSRISASRAIKSHKSVAPSKPETKEQSRDAVTVGVFSQEMLDNNCAAAKRYGVEPAVHAADFTYWFHVAHPVHEFVVVPIRLYFDEGAKSAHKLVAIIASQGLRGEEKVRLLEFASGYGRLSRHLKQYPHIDLVCADIHNDAIEFFVNTIGVKAFISNPQPEEFLYEEKFDVTFALSFLRICRRFRSVIG